MNDPWFFYLAAVIAVLLLAKVALMFAPELCAALAAGLNMVLGAAGFVARCLLALVP